MLADKLMKYILAIIVMSLLIGCDANTRSAVDYAEYYLADTKTSEEIKDAIRKGVVIKGMCPFQAFAAAGLPGPYMVRADRDVWDHNVLPPVIISAQCEHPDNSVIELMFRNKTQFNTKKAYCLSRKISQRQSHLNRPKEFYRRLETTFLRTKSKGSLCQLLWGHDPTINAVSQRP